MARNSGRNRRKTARFWLHTAIGLGATAVIAQGCSDPFESCEERRSCAPGGAAGMAAGGARADVGGAVSAEGGHAGDGGGAGGNGDSGGPSIGGQTIGSGGALGGSDNSGGSDQGGTSDTGGATSILWCDPGQYQPWVTSSFSYPDGEAIGAADFPSMPWTSNGVLRIVSGRLTGVGTATMSQGGSFPYDGLRIRYRVRFTDSNQRVTVAFNSAEDGTSGLRLTLSGTGELILSEGTAERARGTLPPLDTDVDWFVEAEVDGAEARASIARTNYGSATGGTTVGSIRTHALKQSATGTKTSITLESDAGISPTVDELSVSRCGVTPPTYQPVFVDTFSRADSSSLGNAEYPSASTWSSTTNTPAAIVNMGLEVKGLARADIALAKPVPSAGVRLRTSFTVRDVNSWAEVHYNASSQQSSSMGFWLWGDGPDTCYTMIFPRVGQEKTHSGTGFFAGEKFYAELDVDSGMAALTVRRQSFTGPIFVTDVASGFSDPGGSILSLSTATGFDGKSTLFDDVRIDQYSW